jgi:hypothetical protein
LILLAVVVTAVSVGAGLARAILFGTPDATNQYAGVGLIVFYDAHNFPLWKCTGALVSPTVLLTAGHCTGFDPASGFTPARAQVWFSNGYPKEIPPGTLITENAPPDATCDGYTGYPCTGDVGGTPKPHPGWTGEFTFPNTNDIGVVVLDHAVSLPTYKLAPVGTLDGLAARKAGPTFGIVGYGATQAKPVQGGPRTRYVGSVQLLSLDKKDVDGFGIRMSANPGKGSAICFGDSGGPVFLNGQIVGISSWVQNDPCRGFSGAYRVDTQYARDFLAPFSR